MHEGEARQIAAKLGIPVLNESRGWLHARCPFAEWTHQRGSDRKPSFAIKIEENGVSAYHCLTCKMHGRVSGLVRALEHYRGEHYDGLALEADMADARMDFNVDLSWMVREDELKPLGPDYEDIYDPAWEVPVARRYLEARGFRSRETIDQLGLGYDPDDQRITFPVRSTKGALFGYTGRSVLDEDDYPYEGYGKVRDYLGLPKRNLLLGAEYVMERPDLPLLVVEGLFGWLWLMYIGADEVCNPLAMLGSELTAGKRDIIIGVNSPTFLLFDNDLGGDIGLYGIMKDGVHIGGGAIDNLIEHVPLFVPAWPEDKDDPDQLTFEEVQEMIEHTPQRFPKRKRRR